MNASILTAICAALSLFALPADAAQRGSSNPYPPGITMGVPVGTMPPAGVYVIVKPSGSSGDSVDKRGRKTGGRVDTWANNAQIQWVHHNKLFGANWASFIRNIGVVDVRILSLDGQLLHGRGLPDTLIVPASLSWDLGGGLHFSSALGFYIPNGDTSDPVKIGQNHWTLEPDFALTYSDDRWALTAHAVFNVNFVDKDTRYRNGTTLAIDYTLFRKRGNFEFGPVGYYYAQLDDDRGPKELDGGRPKQFALGLGGSYRLDRGKLTLTFTRDLEARNLAKKEMVLLIASYRL